MVADGLVRAGVAGALVVAGCATGGAGADKKSEALADLVLRNGAVYTVDAVRSWASAVAVRDGRIVYVGQDSLPPGLIAPKDRGPVIGFVLQESRRPHDAVYVSGDTWLSRGRAVTAP